MVVLNSINVNSTSCMCIMMIIYAMMQLNLFDTRPNEIKKNNYRINVKINKIFETVLLRAKK